jgi:stage II sporulation protein D
VRTLRVPQVLTVLGAMAVASCAPGPAPVTMPGAVARRPVTRSVRVQVHEGAHLVVRQVPLEEYVEATVLSEVSPDPADERAAERMFEVQAIIARTYAVANVGRHEKDGFDLCSTTHCQLYEPGRLRTSRWAALAHEAVQKTAGQLLWFGAAPANALFHADCGGHTSAAAAVWGGPGASYLVGETDALPAHHLTWTFDTRAAALRDALNEDQRTAVGARLDRVEISGRDAAGRAEMITLHGTRTFVVRGEVFRDVVTRMLGVKSIRSTLFSVTRTGDRFAFSGKGYGHGVGLCQAGALARIRAGASVETVLAHYFPGTRIA